MFEQRNGGPFLSLFSLRVTEKGTWVYLTEKGNSYPHRVIRHMGGAKENSAQRNGGSSTLHYRRRIYEHADRWIMLHVAVRTKPSDPRIVGAHHLAREQ